VKVLIADTNPEILDDILPILNQYQPDWQLSIINAGKKCLDVIKNGNCPDIVILGMRLSDMSGFELIRYIRDDSDVPVVFLSDNKNMEILEKAFDAGANEYMVKPFNKAIFVARLKALIRRRTWDIQSNELSEINNYVL
jgi:DNA-binding response OmpR family regulator